jgi:hypothetical protein
MRKWIANVLCTVHEYIWWMYLRLHNVSVIPELKRGSRCVNICEQTLMEALQMKTPWNMHLLILLHLNVRFWVNAHRNKQLQFCFCIDWMDVTHTERSFLCVPLSLRMFHISRHHHVMDLQGWGSLLTKICQANLILILTGSLWTFSTWRRCPTSVIWQNRHTYKQTWKHGIIY